MLERLGYRVDVAANGLEVLEALRRQPYDVVLMDVQMPEMDGLMTTRQIHQHWPPHQRPRLVAMTANAMQGDREACLRAGMDDYISKPIRTEELMQALLRCPSHRVALANTPSLSAVVIEPQALEKQKCFYKKLLIPT
jgi:CheY-like chemotaxis protein